MYDWIHLWVQEKKTVLYVHCSMMNWIFFVQLSNWSFMNLADWLLWMCVAFIVVPNLTFLLVFDFCVSSFGVRLVLQWFIGYKSISKISLNIRGSGRFFFPLRLKRNREHCERKHARKHVLSDNWRHAPMNWIELNFHVRPTLIKWTFSKVCQYFMQLKYRRSSSVPSISFCRIKLYHFFYRIQSVYTLYLVA